MILVPAGGQIRREQNYPFAPLSWQGKAIQATGGNRSKTGAIVLAILAQTPPEPPAFGHGAVITSDGFVMCDFLDRDNVLHTGAFVSSVDELTSNFRRLRDHLKLTDAEGDAMFTYLRGWIKKDWRSNPAPL